MKKKRLLPLLLILPILASCGNDPISSMPNTGKWITISASNTLIPTTNGGVAIPFNTAMILKYFKNDNKKYEDDFDKKLSDLYINNTVKLHKEFDRHYYYLNDNNEKITNAKVINDYYGTGEEVECSEELYTLLKLGYQMTIATDGYFNFYIGNLVSFWDDIFEEVYDYPPSIEEQDPYYNESAKKWMENYTKTIPTIDEVKSIMTFNDSKRTVIFNALDDLVIDGVTYPRNAADSLYRPYLTTGGIAKGLATDFLKINLKENGYEEGYLNSGSSSISSLGNLDFTEKGYQTMNVVDPRYGDLVRQIAYSIDLHEEYNLSTSANYSLGKSYVVCDEEGNIIKRRHHIINPFTGESSMYHDSVTIISSNLTNGELDALSTAFVNLPMDKGLKLKEEYLKSHPNKDLSIIFSDIDGDKLNLYASKDLKNSIKIKGEGVNVYYE